MVQLWPLGHPLKPQRLGFEWVVVFQICTFVVHAILASSCEGGPHGTYHSALPYCQSDQVIKGSKTQAGQQRYKCLNVNCPRYSFQLDLTYKGLSPKVKERIIDMVLNGSGIRDTAQVLKVSPTTVINELKKIDHRSDKVLAYVFGRRKDEVLRCF